MDKKFLINRMFNAYNDFKNEKYFYKKNDEILFKKFKPKYPNKLESKNSKNVFSTIVLSTL